MDAKPLNQSTQLDKDLSWSLFLAIWAAFLFPLWLVGYCVVYTEGEVFHDLFRGLTVLVGLLVLLGFRRRKVAAAWIACICGALLFWQAWQVRKWAMIHEEVLELLGHVRDFKRENGAFPESLDGHAFERAWVKEHIMSYRREGSKFRLVYFMNNPGISYWYDSDSGFGYYPD